MRINAVEFMYEESCYKSSTSKNEKSNRATTYSAHSVAGNKSHSQTFCQCKRTPVA